ncbi:DNA polymerase III, beta subunit [Dethiosulfovibrio peptidovorans DSM 11002]|uniref:Beta sliding clamp n=1 Tax=Dethiosulfovibrio peptidovorans DSM 11002 TaxID=469381 RepID=D2Z679_9BACT|nr:DNA polymerase III subunit beta [Dethiosulfovibrio peptidovorans]EFC90976.1 DNA polymerase III, beta subunit [Dethiosulfovibrio peptidovorans DSM 11002]
MKLTIDKTAFMKSWNVAERVAAQKSTLSVLSGILCTAEDGKVTLQATDLKTSVKVKSEGVTIDEPGKAVLPIKVVGELFKKSPTSIFTVEVAERGTGILLSGRNRYRFTTYPADDFPPLPSPEGASQFCVLAKDELHRILDEGGIAGSMGEEFPKYLGAELLQVKSGECHCVSTDGRRLSLSKAYVDKENPEQDMLLPLTSVREFLRILSGLGEDLQVNVSVDGALGYFQLDSLEFSVRRVDSSFPNYERILSPNTTTTLDVDRSQFISALERVDVVVRDHSRMVVLILSPGGDLKLSGRAPEIGEATEIVDGIIKGESLKVAFNVGFLIDGLKAFHGDKVSLSFNGQEGQMMMLRPNESDFLYMLMPIKLKSADLDGLDDGGDDL